MLYYILQSSDGRYFQANPAKPQLTRRLDSARLFDSELLAEDFRQFIELSGRSFQVAAVVGGAL
jgi:hypothetical protein